MRTSWKTLGSGLLIVFFASSLAGAASAAGIDTATIDKNRKANEACYACHSAAGIATPPKPGMDMAKLKDSHVEKEVFNNSDHGVMDCRECHSSKFYGADYPHGAEGKTATSACSECHAAKVLRLEPQFNASVHAKVQGVKEKFACHTCHNVHINVIQKRLKDPDKIVAQDNHGCLECHNSDATFAKFAVEGEKTPGIKKKRPDIDTIHDWLPNTKAHWKAVRCIDCHTPAAEEAKMLSHEIQNKDKAEKKCLSCHSADSALRVRLYRHMVKEEQQKYGFTNTAILSNSYVIGATRHPLLDQIVIGLALLTLLGVLGHGLLRIIAAQRRKGEKQ
jgi:hypothetical protein